MAAPRVAAGGIRACGAWRRHGGGVARGRDRRMARQPTVMAGGAICDSARGSGFSWLVGQFERLRCDSALRESLYDNLELFLTLHPHDAPISRTLARGLAAATFYHRGSLLREVDADRLVAMPLRPPRRLGRDACDHLVDAAR